MTQYKLINTCLNFYQVETRSDKDNYKYCQYMTDLHIEKNDTIEKKWIVMSRSDNMRDIMRKLYGDDVLFFHDEKDVIEMVKQINISLEK